MSSSRNHSLFNSKGSTMTIAAVIALASIMIFTAIHDTKAFAETPFIKITSPMDGDMFNDMTSDQQNPRENLVGTVGYNISSVANAEIHILVDGQHRATLKDGLSSGKTAEPYQVKEFTIDPDPFSGEVQYEITANLLDNSKTVAMDTVTVTYDITEPPKPRITAPVSIVTSATVLVQGTAEAHSNVTVKAYRTAAPAEKNAFTKEITTPATGNWELNVILPITANPLKDDNQNYTINASATDRAGNTGETETRKIILNKDVPNPPVITSVTPNATNVPGADLTIKGTTDHTQNKVSIYLRGPGITNPITAKAIVDKNDATWTVTLSPGLDATKRDDLYMITTNTTDLFGQTSVMSDASYLRIDNIAPATPRIDRPVYDGAVTSLQVTLTGEAEPSSAINITNATDSPGVGTSDSKFAARAILATTTTTSNGTWMIQVTLPEVAAATKDHKPDVYYLGLISIDEAGNTAYGAYDHRLRLNLIDTAGVAITTKSMYVNSQNVSIAGTTSPHSSITLNITHPTNQSVTTLPVTADDQGMWMAYAPLSGADGPYTIYAMATDTQNHNTTSPPVTLTLDTTPPKSIAITSHSDHSAIKTVTPTISGTSANATHINITINEEPATTTTTTTPGDQNGAASGKTTTAPTQANGDWSATITLPVLERGHNDRFNIAAIAIDEAGNTNSTSIEIALFKEDPPTPTITSPAPGDYITSSDVTVTGTSEPHTTVTIKLGNSTKSTMTDASGSYTAKMTTPGDGTHIITATATDYKDIQSSSSPPFTITTDTSETAITSPSTTDNSTTIYLTEVTLTGTSVFNANITLSIDGNYPDAPTTTASANGSWSLTATIPASTTQQNHTLKVTATDAATGFSSSASVTVTFVPPVITPTAAVYSTGDNTITITFDSPITPTTNPLTVTNAENGMTLVLTNSTNPTNTTIAYALDMIARTTLTTFYTPTITLPLAFTTNPDALPTYAATLNLTTMDTAPPQLVSATYLTGTSELVLTFTETISIQSIAGDSITTPAATNTVTTTTDSDTITLTTSSQPTSVTITALTDTSSNTIVTTTTSTITIQDTTAPAITSATYGATEQVVVVTTDEPSTITQIHISDGVTSTIAASPHTPSAAPPTHYISTANTAVPSPTSITITSMDKLGNSGTSTSAITLQGTLGEILPAPINVKVARTASPDALYVTWDQPYSSPAISEYTLRYKLSEGGSWMILDHPITSTSATISGLENAQTYKIRVLAINTAGNVSPASERALGTPIDFSIPQPSAPTNVTLTPSNNSIIVNWINPDDNIADHVILYKLFNDQEYIRTWINSSSTTYTITNLENGEPYKIRVKAVTTDNIRSPPSATAATTPADPSHTKPAAPANLTATPGNAHVLLTWTAPPTSTPEVTSYKIITTTPDSRTVTTTQSTDTYAVIQDLTNEQEYTFTVRATNAAGDSPISAPSTTTPTTGMSPSS